MNNYVVIEGGRYDFKDISKITEDCCSVCTLKNFCDIEDCPCSVFNASTNIYPHSPQYAFVKRVKTSNNGKESIKNKVTAKYIDKNALVAEIRKRLLPVVRDKHYDEWEEGQDSERKATLGIIDTLEVKEVDLEKELVKYHNDNFSPCNDGTLLSSDTGNGLTWCDYERISKHFFELGLKAQKGE